MWIFIETKLWVKYRKMSVWNEIFSRNEQSTCLITQFFAGALLCTFQEFVREIANQSINESDEKFTVWKEFLDWKQPFVGFILLFHFMLIVKSQWALNQNRLEEWQQFIQISWIFNAVFHTKRTKSYCEKFRRRSLLLSIDDDGKILMCFPFQHTIRDHFNRMAAAENRQVALWKCILITHHSTIATAPTNFKWFYSQS